MPSNLNKPHYTLTTNMMPQLLIVSLAMLSSSCLAFVLPPPTAVQPLITVTSTCEGISGDNHVQGNVNVQVPKIRAGMMSSLTSNQLSMLLAMEKDQRSEFLDNIQMAQTSVHPTTQHELKLATKAFGTKKMGQAIAIMDDTAHHPTMTKASSIIQELEDLEALSQEYDSTVMQDLLEASKDFSSSLFYNDNAEEIAFEKIPFGKVHGTV